MAIPPKIKQKIANRRAQEKGSSTSAAAKAGGRQFGQNRAAAAKAKRGSVKRRADGRFA